ncbi:MAG: L-lactate dehydrogenase [Oscillospiraceae bacterium]|nr:L-lactate dehydrogenase [Oscillospiraceae bacterium]
MNSGKVAIIGVGYVGSSIAYALTIKGTAREIVLIEQSGSHEKCKAEISDIRHGIPFMGTSDIYNGDYSDIKDCDLIIITAGRNRKPGEKRIDMKNDNLKTAAQVANEIKKHYTKGVVLIVTNPVDTITRAMSEWLDLPDGIVFGTGCLLDSSRFVNVVADYAGITSNSINAHIIGEHGEGQIALWSKVMIAGIPIEEYCQMTGIPFTNETKIIMEEKVRLMGAEIIKGKGRTHFGIATCVCYIADAILNHRPTIVSVSSMLQGEYGISRVALSLPCVVDSSGVERRLMEKLSELELSRLTEVADSLLSVWE